MQQFISILSLLKNYIWPTINNLFSGCIGTIIGWYLHKGKEKNQTKNSLLGKLYLLIKYKNNRFSYNNSNEVITHISEIIPLLRSYKLDNEAMILEKYLYQLNSDYKNPYSVPSYDILNMDKIIAHSIKIIAQLNG